VGETTTVPTTTKPTTTIPITTQGLDQSKYLVYNENQYKQAINESTKVNNNIDNINDKINLINQVATMDANYQYNDNEIKKELNQKFLDNIDTIVNKQLQESSDFNKNDPEIKKLKEQITDLENIIQAMGIRKKKQTTYNQIKSINNGQEFCLINTDYNDNITKDVKKGYQIQMNNGCLSVGQNDYTVNKCDSKNPKQQFKMVHILNDLMYSNNIDKLLPFATPDKTKTNYPFVIMIIVLLIITDKLQFNLVQF